jgi:hypothetical protein
MMRIAQSVRNILDKLRPLAGGQVLLFLSLGLVLVLNLYFRSFPINFPQLKIQARDMIEKSLRQSIAQDVYKKFPHFYPLANEVIISSRFNQYKKQNAAGINSQIRELYGRLKDRFQDESGKTYIMELDCWHWARYVDNVIKLGHPGDEVINGRQWDKLMLAPLGRDMLWNQLLFYLSAYMYNIFCLFAKVPLFRFLFYLPIFFSLCFTALLYLFSFRNGRYIGAVTASLFVGLSPMLLQRSCAGWFDMDILNIIFPLLVAWTYIVSTVNRSEKGRLFWIAFSAFWLGLFCFTWPFWWFIFMIIVMYEFSLIGYLAVLRLFFKKKNAEVTRVHVRSLTIFTIASVFWILVFSGPAPLIELFNAVLRSITLTKPLMASIWPNVYFTVGELRRPSVLDLARSLGGVWIFSLSIASLVILLLRSLFMSTCSSFKRTSMIIMAIWTASMIFATLRGVRFIMFLLIPLGTSLGWAIDDLYRYMKEKKMLPGMLCALLIFALVCGVSIRSGYRAAGTLYPLMDDGWYKMLNLMKEKTPPDTIVNSWWDFGDWFKVVADRRVIFDGQSQDTPQAYWMAKALLSNNEEEAVAILRMLNNGGNRAYEIINQYVTDQLKAVLLLERLLVSDPEKAQAILLDFLPPQAARQVWEILFRTPPNAGFVVDYSMMPKIGAISYLGNWNFAKVYIAQNFNKLEQNQITDHLKNLGGRREDEIQTFYQEAFLLSNKMSDEWLSRTLRFYSDIIKGSERDGTVYYGNGFAFTAKEQMFQSTNGQIPQGLFMATPEGVVEASPPNPNVPYSVLMYKMKDEYKAVLLDYQLGKSLFTRLYFLRGQGLRHFAPVIEVDDGNNYILYFKIVW